MIFIISLSCHTVFWFEFHFVLEKKECERDEAYCCCSMAVVFARQTTPVSEQSSSLVSAGSRTHKRADSRLVRWMYLGDLCRVLGVTLNLSV